MMRASECQCINPKTGGRLHNQWECKNGKHSVYHRPHVQSCVVHWSRNSLISQFLWGVQPEGRLPADYALLVDDDMVVEPNYLNRLLSYRLDFVAGICTRRRDPPSPAIKFWNEKLQGYVEPIEWQWDAEKLIEIDACGVAFALIHRRVFEKMAEAFLNCHFEREADKGKFPSEMHEKVDAYWNIQSVKRKKFQQESLSDWQATQNPRSLEAAGCWWFNFLWNPTGNEKGEFAEDISFCWRAKKLGFRIFADPQILPGHIGDYYYSVRDWQAHVENCKEEGLIQKEMEQENTPKLEAVAGD